MEKQQYLHKTNLTMDGDQPEGAILTTRYFVVKCASVDALRRCVNAGKWACRERNNPPQPHEFLTTAFKQGPVTFLFSVNNCHGWHGFCHMITPPIKYSCDDEYHDKENDGHSRHAYSPDKSQPTDIWHHFTVKWQTQLITEFGERCLPSLDTQDFLLPDGTPLNKARGWHEMSADVGNHICHLLDKYHADLVDQRLQKKEEKLAAQPLPFLETEVGVEDHGATEQYWRYVVEKVERELGNVHLACPFGSQRYNLHRPGSDIDAFIVYQAQTRDLLRLDPPKQTLKNSERASCDYTVLELQRYCELLLAGDPRCVETLFLDDSTIVQASSQWRQLQEHRPKLPMRKCLDKYLSDALGSNGVKRFRRWLQENPGMCRDDPPPTRIAKLVYIIIRLLQNAVDIVKGRPLCVFRPDGSTAQQILRKIRKADISLREVEAAIEELQAEIDSGKERVMHDSSDIKQQVENWLLSLRFTDFQLHPAV